MNWLPGSLSQWQELSQLKYLDIWAMLDSVHVHTQMYEQVCPECRSRPPLVSFVVLISVGQRSPWILTPLVTCCAPSRPVKSSNYVEELKSPQRGGAETLSLLC